MDTKYEDTILSQIEKNLSNNINEDLFMTGRIYDSSNSLTKRKYLQEQEESKNLLTADQEYPLVSTSHISDMSPPMSRAEFIRQAREACLRQLNDSQFYSRPYEANYVSMDVTGNTAVEGKKGLHHKLFDSQKANEDSPEEIAAFRSLLIRFVGAIILFLIIFIIDKFDIKIGSMTGSALKEYITGNDALKALEDMVVAWLK